MFTHKIEDEKKRKELKIILDKACKSAKAFDRPCQDRFLVEGVNDILLISKGYSSSGAGYTRDDILYDTFLESLKGGKLPLDRKERKSDSGLTEEQKQVRNRTMLTLRPRNQYGDVVKPATKSACEEAIDALTRRSYYDAHLLFRQKAKPKRKQGSQRSSKSTQDNHKAGSGGQTPCHPNTSRFSSGPSIFSRLSGARKRTRKSSCTKATNVVRSRRIGGPGY